MNVKTLVLPGDSRWYFVQDYVCFEPIRNCNTMMICDNLAMMMNRRARVCDAAAVAACWWYRQLEFGMTREQTEFISAQWRGWLALTTAETLDGVTFQPYRPS